MSLWIKSCGLTINMKPLQQYVHRVQFIQYVVLTLSVNEIIWCDHSNKTSSAVLSHGTLYLVCSCNSGSTLVVFVFNKMKCGNFAEFWAWLLLETTVKGLTWITYIMGYTARYFPLTVSSIHHGQHDLIICFIHALRWRMEEERTQSKLQKWFLQFKLLLQERMQMELTIVSWELVNVTQKKRRNNFFGNIQHSMM